MLAYIHTVNGISILLNGATTLLAKDDPRYQPVLDELNSGYDPDEIALTELLATPKAKLEAHLEAEALSETVSIDDDTVYYKGQPVDNSLTRRMLEHLRLGISVAPLVPFLENLLQNPSFRAVQDLYSFLEKGGIPLTTDGHFLAYKYVSEDFKDCYSGQFDNSIGKVVEMPRNQVDEDPNCTCSRGLHVCSYDYLPKTSGGVRVVIVKVNPKNVVAIPADYNDTKMRVCRYEVVGEVEGYVENHRNILSEQPVYGDWNEGGNGAGEIASGIEAEQHLSNGAVFDRRRDDH